MKKYLLSLTLILGAGSIALAQSYDQNPRARDAYLKYEMQTDSAHASSLGATVDKTYEAYDPIRIKEERREDRREFRRQLRLERARNRFFYDPYPFGVYRNNWWW